ncbi:unnamed protein product [Commensalibacter communis]|uniref:hypothetical protein n=1 Tax=Commensalibacter communis TaxID=2972786 RepID=UPI0022FF56B3|nr:hypothetical protein [Commensalibacter communis]CAI3929547.1 unnamed protein product [Commensalibacter communis]
MAQNTDNVLVRIDLWILDTVFQPIANRLPGERMNIRLGMNLLLGSVIFSFAFLLMPLFFFNVGFFNSTYNLMSCIVVICFYMFVYRNQEVVREGFINPLRYHLFGIRIISIPFTLYGIYIWLSSGGMAGRFTMLYCISNILSVCGLYLISCNINPPKKKEEHKVAFADNPFS